MATTLHNTRISNAARVSLSSDLRTATYLAYSIFNVYALTDVSSGVHYWEVVYDAATSVGSGHWTAGIADYALVATASPVGFSSDSFGIRDNGRFYTANTYVTHSTLIPTAFGDVYRFKLDLDNSTLDIALNGGAFVTVSTTIPTGIEYTPAFSGANGEIATFNFAATDFVYSVPTGASELPASPGVQIANNTVTTTIEQPNLDSSSVSQGAALAASSVNINTTIEQPNLDSSSVSHGLTSGLSMSNIDLSLSIDVQKSFYVYIEPTQHLVSPIIGIV